MDTAELEYDTISQNRRLTRKEKRDLHQHRKSQQQQRNLNKEKLNFTLKDIHPLTQNQELTFEAYSQGKHLMLHGVAGTGKSFLALYLALNQIFNETSLYSTVNKKVTGKMKDETAGVPIYEFCGLRSKLYSIKTLQYFSKDGKPTTELHTGKGIWRKILEHHLRHEDYKRGIFHEGQAENISQKADMWNLVCKRHN